MWTHSQNTQIDHLFLKYKIIGDKIKDYIKHGICTTTCRVTKRLTRKIFFKRFIKPIQQLNNRCFQYDSMSILTNKANIYSVNQ